MSVEVSTSRPPAEPVLYGLLAEFDDPAALARAAAAVRQKGYTRWDAHSPFPVHGLDEAMGARRTRLPLIALIAGLCGLIGGLKLAWYTNASDLAFMPSFLRGYPFMISGKPVFSLPANIPVVFETTVLLAALGTVLGMLGLNRLPRLHHPLFASERFARATTDRFFIVIEARDPRFDRRAAAEFLRSLGAAAVEEVAEGPP